MPGTWHVGYLASFGRKLFLKSSMNSNRSCQQNVTWELDSVEHTLCWLL
jgi:hypothetical protein